MNERQKKVAQYCDGVRTSKEIALLCEDKPKYVNGLDKSGNPEGFSTLASGLYSHAEGALTTASGDYSHAEGEGTRALANSSHAEGLYTIASARRQHVQGMFNITSSAEGAFIVGNGSAENNRSNLVFAAGNSVQITGSLTVSGSIAMSPSSSFILPLSANI